MNEMINLVTNENGKAMTTSLKIAEVFGKDHSKVLRSIREKLELFNEANFGLVDYTDNKGESRPMYLLDRDFTTFLIMGFTGKKADQFKLDYISAFNQMEQIIKEAEAGLTARDRAILNVINAKNEIERANAFIELENVITTPLIETIEEQKPKADYYDSLIDCEHLTNIRNTAKELGVKERTFVAWLLDNKYLYRDANRVLRPYANRMKYFAEKDFKSKNGSHTDARTLITVEGKSLFKKLLEEGA